MSALRHDVRGDPGGNPERPLAGWLPGLPATGPRRSAGDHVRGVRPALARWPAARLCAVPRGGRVSGQRWKAQERAVAAALGGQRLPNTGASQCDVRAPGWAVQVKSRTALPAWLWSAVEQATRDAGLDERPALVLCEVRPGVKARRLVVLDLELFAALIGGGRPTRSGALMAGF